MKGTVALLVVIVASGFAEAKPPNVLFFAVDDMRTWVNCMEHDYPGKVHTPNIDRLAARGRLFTNAHVPAPKCGPCRAAVLTGQRPSRLGIYGNGQWLHPNFPELVTLPAHFKQHGYRVVGAGKIAHHTAGFNPPSDWHDFQEIDWEDPWDRPRVTYPNKRSIPRPDNHPIAGFRHSRHEADWGSLPEGYDYHDPKSADYAVRFLQTYDGDQPFFLGCGIFRPHLPWYAPQEYFGLYPLEEIQMPEGLKEDDLADVPGAGKKVVDGRDYKAVIELGKYKQAVQAYLASISFADAQLGRVLDSLEEAGEGQNTLVVFWSDHGWHHGEKGHWHKWTLWEAATHVPMIVAGPGVTKPGTATDQPVSVLALYPTLVDLCGIPRPKQKLDEPSLRPLLENPTAEWNHVAVVERAKNQCAVRTRTHRYIRYHDGSEELYDLIADPHEWVNLVNDEKHRAVLESVRDRATRDWRDPVPSKGAFTFDPKTYQWKRKKK